MLRLASRAMAELARQRRVSAQLELDFSTVTVALAFDVEILLFVVNPIWSSIFPCFGLGHFLAIGSLDGLFRIGRHSATRDVIASLQ